MDAAAVAVEVEAKRDLCVDGLVVLDDPVVPEPQDELWQHGSRLNEARQAELVAHPDVDDPISGVDENSPGYDPDVKLKREVTGEQLYGLNWKHICLNVRYLWDCPQTFKIGY